MRSKIVSALLLLSIYSTCSSQVEAKPQIESYAKMFSIRLINTYYVQDIHLTYNDQNFIYQPFAQSNVALGVFFGSFGINGLASFHYGSDSEESINRNLDLDIFLGQKIILDLDFYVQQGYELIKQPVDEAFRTDLKSNRFKTNITYLPQGERFSLKSSSQYIEKQNKSGGSPVFTLFFNTTRLRADYDFAALPTSQLKPQTIDTRYYNGGMMVGYGHNFIYRNFYLTLLLDAGLGYHVNWLNTKAMHGIFKVRLYSALGYNKRAYQLGIQIFNDNTLSLSALNHSNFTSQPVTSANLFFVYRFGVMHRKFFQVLDSILSLEFLKKKE